ncbi:MAG: hypothetical protein AAGA45_07150 [Verrucomicrobiota bacterium]
MSWRDLAAYREDQGADFYLEALTYGQSLWQRQLSARSLLALDRALFADVPAEAPVLANWPLPYRAILWIILNNPPGCFIGNPRVHFQHLADRLCGEREAQRRWRTWACWGLVQKACPELSGDPKHVVDEPTPECIEKQLQDHGIAGEGELWKNVYSSIPDLIKAARP